MNMSFHHLAWNNDGCYSNPICYCCMRFRPKVTRLTNSRSNFNDEFLFKTTYVVERREVENFGEMKKSSTTITTHSVRQCKGKIFQIKKN